jgi:uncharacterized protein
MIPTTRFDPVPALRVLAAAALTAVATTGFAAEVAERPLRTTTLKIAGHALKVEVAQKEEDLQKGLMFRKSMPANEGMLFVFQDREYHAMWMKNTFIPLSVAFVDQDGTILNILDMEPHTLDSHQSAGPSIYAIETNKGWFAQRKVKAGDKVTGLPKAK